MDEPFGALDAQVRWEMQELMIELIEREENRRRHHARYRRGDLSRRPHHLLLASARADQSRYSHLLSKVVGGSRGRKSFLIYPDTASSNAICFQMMREENQIDPTSIKKL